jgi:hypothetical protein
LLLASQPLLRFALLLGVLAISIALVAAHGVRGIAILVGVFLILTLPRSRAWQAVERPLVRLTGSRKRAAVVVTLVVLGTAAAINIYQFVG